LFGAMACGSKDEGKEPPAPPPPPAQVAGLDAIPGDAQAVVGVNVAALGDSALIARGIRGVLDADPELERRIDGLLGACGLDVGRDLESLLVATGATATDAVMVVTGALDEDAIPKCIGAAVAAAGGALVQKAETPRSIWLARPSSGTSGVWFAFGAPRTLVVSVTQPWLEAALARGGKVSDNAELMAVLMRADRTAGLWAAGRVDPRLGTRLMELTSGAVKAPVRFMFAHLHVDKGVRAQLGAIMASEADAAAAAAFARAQLEPYTMVAQGIGLGGLVSQVRVEAEKDTVFLRLRLSADAVKEVISQIDRALARE
jgi:hypothetical protein